MHLKCWMHSDRRDKSDCLCVLSPYVSSVHFRWSLYNHTEHRFFFRISSFASLQLHGLHSAWDMFAISFTLYIFIHSSVSSITSSVSVLGLTNLNDYIISSWLGFSWSASICATHSSFSFCCFIISSDILFFSCSKALYLASESFLNLSKSFLTWTSHLLFPSI